LAGDAKTPLQNLPLSRRRQLLHKDKKKSLRALWAVYRSEPKICWAARMASVSASASPSKGEGAASSLFKLQVPPLGKVQK
jgi:hypothetical protein